MSLKQEIETWVLALGHYDNNEFEEALKVFDKIADTSKILFNCGVIHASLGAHAKAVECYQRAVSLDNYLAVAYFQQGVSNFLIGDFEEALANFNDTLLYLRGNTSIDYDQLGLKFRLFSCEVLFNRGLCYIYLQQTSPGMADLEYAAKEKVKPDHDVIDEAIRERAEGYTVFSIPVGVVYRPNDAKVKNLKTKDYLGKARLVATSDRSNVFTGFQGSEIKKTITQEMIAKDDRPAENISYAATNLVQKNLVSRGRQQSEPPMDRNRFPPTPPPDSDKGSIIGGNSSVDSGLGLSTDNIAPARAGPPPRLNLEQPGTKGNGRTGGEMPSMERSRHGNMRTASEPRGPPRRYSNARARDVGRPRLYGETTGFGSRRGPNDYGTSVTEEDGYGDDLFDAYGNNRSIGSGREMSARKMRHAQPYVDEVETSDPYDDLVEDGEFEMMAASRSRARGVSQSRSIRKFRIKVHAQDDTRYIMIGPKVGFGEFEGKIRDKFGFKSQLKIRMQDDGDMITMGDQDDLELLFSTAKEAARRERLEMGKMEIWVEER